MALIGSVALSGCSALNSGPTTTTTVTVAKNPNGAPAAPGAEGTAGAAEQRSPEDFPRAVAGRNTSAAFAENVRQQFVQQWVKDGNTNTTVVATSPVTGGTYTMTCSGEDVIHCTGGNDAHVYIYSKNAPEGAQGADDAAGAVAGGQSFTGTIRDLTGYEFAALYPSRKANPPMAGDRVMFLELDAPVTLTLGKPGAAGSMFTDTATEIRFKDPFSSPYAGRNGERVTITIDPSQCTWPSDTTPPTGAPGCSGI